MLVGVPDGMGAYLLDATTVRVIMQSESYGPLNWWCSALGCGDSYPFAVNSNGASFTGSHVMYIDYDRAQLAEFMTHEGSAAPMVKDAGNVIKSAYNLAGNMVEPRKESGCTTNPHYSNTDPSGCNDGWNTIMQGTAPERADWVMQSLCSAHLEEKHQWGGRMGVEDTLFLTNEEYTPPPRTCRHDLASTDLMLAHLRPCLDLASLIASLRTCGLALTCFLACLPA